MEVWAADEPETKGPSVEVEPQEHVIFSGTFIGGATVQVEAVVGGETVLSFDTVADGAGLMTNGIRAEESDAGTTATITATVPETECTASVQVIVLE